MATPPPDYEKGQPRRTPSAEFSLPPYPPPGQGQMAPYPQNAYQPQAMMPHHQQHTTVIVQQPAANVQNDRILGLRDGHRDWSSGLFSCCDDVGKCLWAMCCPSCVLADISARLGECYCVTCCVPGGLVTVRTRVRTLGGIRGSICMDYLATEFCNPCVMCQLQRELDYMGL